LSPTRRILVGAVVIAVGLAWYFFRPETAFLNRQVDEAAPGGSPTIVFTGSFEPRAHKGHGRADVMELPGGERLLRLSDFETLDGPDLAVYFLGSPDPASRSDLAKTPYLSLGPLKGNVGAQNYAIPAGTDMSQYHAVAVWCRRFGVNFTTAALRPAQSGS
jgi:Electron transfer DM13